MTSGASIPVCQAKGRPLFGKDKPWLAPLAGYSDLPFRMLCREFGAAVTVTEMVSAKGLVYGTPATARLLMNSQKDAPLIVQLFGSEPAIIGQAIRMLRVKGFNNFDFNLGCPVRKVFRQHSGAALLDDKALLLEIASAIVKAVKEDLPDSNMPPGFLGFKLRSGTRPENRVLPEIALALEDIGADWLAIHPRYASQGYGGHANWEHIEQVAKRTSIPVLASGDLWDAEKGLECLAQTGAAGLMYARGALYYPAIFVDHCRLLRKEKVRDKHLANIIAIIKRHIGLARQLDSSRHSFIRMRSLIPRYTRSFGGAQDLRLAICQCADWQELDALLSNLPEKFTSLEGKI